MPHPKWGCGPDESAWRACGTPCGFPPRSPPDAPEEVHNSPQPLLTPEIARPVGFADGHFAGQRQIDSLAGDRDETIAVRRIPDFKFRPGQHFFAKPPANLQEFEHAGPASASVEFAVVTSFALPKPELL